MINERSYSLLGNCLHRLVHGMSELLHEVPHELGNIGWSVAERRQRDRESIQPIVEIFAEFPVSDQQRQIPIGRGNDTHIDSRGARAAYWFELTLLEHAEQLRLKFQRHISNFIEEQSAADLPTLKQPTREN